MSLLQRFDSLKKGTVSVQKINPVTYLLQINDYDDPISLLRQVL